MTTETMNVHKALSELKVLDKRCADAINSSTFCVANEHANMKIKGRTIPEVKTQMQADYDNVTALIARRKALRRALMLSNAQTKVTIAGEEYTVAEAIEMRNHGIELDQLLLSSMSTQYNRCTVTIDMNNKQVLEKAEEHIQAMYANKEGKVNVEDTAQARQMYIDLHSYDMIDPLNVSKKIEQIKAHIDAFMSEVDSVLSVSNALTMITIEY